MKSRYDDAEEVGFFESRAYTEWWDAGKKALAAGEPVLDFLGNVLISDSDFDVECCYSDEEQEEVANLMLAEVEERAAHSFWKAKQRGELKC